MKSGYAAGILAGCVGGVAVTFSRIIDSLIDMLFGIPWMGLDVFKGAIPINILLSHLVDEIGINAIFGAIFGILYAKFHDFIPGKGVLKGLYFGLMLYLISNLRTASFFWIYGGISWAWGYAWAGFWAFTVYGIVLSVIYDKKAERGEKEYSMRSGTFVGTFAGLISGIIAFIFTVISVYLGLSPPQFPHLSNFLINIENLAMVEILLNTIWGAVFGAIFAIFYKRIPSKGILKGFYFGMLFYLIANIRPAFLGGAHGAISWASMLTFVGFFLFSSYGLIFGVLYKPPK